MAKRAPDLFINILNDNQEIMDVCSSAVKYFNDFKHANPMLNMYDEGCLSMALKYVGAKAGLSYKTDAYILDIYWDIYVLICIYYYIKPTVQRFGIFSHIAKETMASWANDWSKVSSPYSQSAKKWRDECESALYDDVIKTGNIGAMFALKANFGYRDNVVINIQQTNTGSDPDRLPSDIAKDYAMIDNNDVKPEF